MLSVIKLQRFIVAVLLFLFAIISCPSRVSAQDNDDLGESYNCTIVIGGQNAMPGKSGVPRVISNLEPQDGNPGWTVSVQLSNAALEQYNQCRGELRMATSRGWPVAWTKTLLTPQANGLFTGVLYYSQGASHSDSGVKDIDIEMDGASSCHGDNFPICRRMYIQLDGSRTEREGFNCDADKQKIRESLDGFPSTMTLDTTGFVSIDVPESIIQSCPISRLNYEIKLAGKNEAHGNIMNNSKIESTHISFTPKYVGQYEIILHGYPPDTGPSTHDPRLVVTKYFCVAHPGETCTPPLEESVLDNYTGPNAPFDYCAQVPGKDVSDIPDSQNQYLACTKCMGSLIDDGTYENEGKKIYTAVGCVRVDGPGLAADLIKILLGVAGMASFLSIIAGAFIFTTSRGESGKIKQAKELITAAISGLLFIIFSIIILEYIGVTILHIPGLG